MRRVLLDTETTGLDPATGDRVIEVAAIELVNDLATGEVFHRLIDPERDIPDEASRIHGFRIDDLRGKPKFADIADDLLVFLGDAELIAHNAPFDFGFLNAELARVGRDPLPHARMIDTLAIARTRFPGMPHSLDALCRRFNIDLSERTTHNALLDCRLLAEVYVELIGGRQRGFDLKIEQARLPTIVYVRGNAGSGRPIVPSPDDLAAHARLVARLKDAVWNQA